MSLEIDYRRIQEGMHEFMKYGLMQLEENLDNASLKISKETALKVWSENYSNIAKKFIPVMKYDNQSLILIENKLKGLTNKLK